MDADNVAPQSTASSGQKESEQRAKRRQQDSNLRTQRVTDELSTVLICRRNHLAIAP